MVWSGTCQHSCSSGAWITPCLCPLLLKWGNLRSDLVCKSVYCFWCLCKEKVSKVMWRYMAPYLAPQSSGWRDGEQGLSYGHTGVFRKAVNSHHSAEVLPTSGPSWFLTGECSWDRSGYPVEEVFLRNLRLGHHTYSVYGRQRGYSQLSVNKGTLTTCERYFNSRKDSCKARTCGGASVNQSFLTKCSQGL